MTAVDAVTFNQEFYRRQYRSLNNHVELEITLQELERVTWELLDYMRGVRPEMETITAVVDGVRQPMFNQREIDHMVDVRDLIAWGHRTRLFAAVLLVLCLLLLFAFTGRNSLPILSRTYLWCCVALIGAGVLLYILMQMDFTWVWDQFHYLFFDNDLWLLNPETDRMILMVPEPFFYAAVTRVLVLFGLMMGLPALCFLVYVVQSRGRRRQKEN
jgi:integral membrane protein (TIGR01906 family)